jgi:glycosyltransferase involved in cell wall biosynthesis
MPFLTILTPCFNEVLNIEEVHRRVRDVMSKTGYAYEHLFIDNASTDGTQDLLRRMAAEDERVKVILNTRNFGHIRSPYYGILQANGDAVIGIVADLQDPPELIPKLIEKWESGYKIVMGVKAKTEDNWLMGSLRKLYYRLVGGLSEVRLEKDATGSGLYDRVVVEKLRALNDPYPYFRGLVCDLGYERALVPYEQPIRKRGITKNNFYSLYDTAMLGITNHSKVPLRLATAFGFLLAIASLVVAVGYFGYKLLYWQSFQVGVAPLVIGLFFFSAVQLFFLGIVGEYIGAIHTQVLRRPLVVEKERINFDRPSAETQVPRVSPPPSDKSDGR